jgi:hypothetical protein
MGVFQAICSDSDQVTGNPVEADNPSPVGPRNAGQFSAAEAARPALITDARKKTRLNMTSLSVADQVFS